jgi:guanylate kinase
MSTSEQLDERLGIAFVVSGPSGTGKSSILQQVLDNDDNLRFSTSCTTREPRAGEVDGRDYYFVTHAQFQERIKQNEFIEYALVHDHYYGTLRSEVEQYVTSGRDVILDIDVQGAEKIRAAADGVWAKCTQYLFIGPPSYGELDRRLRDRGTESEDVIDRRLLNARVELQNWREYDYLVVNSNLDEAVQQTHAVITAERMRISRLLADDPWQ